MLNLMRASARESNLFLGPPHLSWSVSDSASEVRLTSESSSVPFLSILKTLHIWAKARAFISLTLRVAFMDYRERESDIDLTASCLRSSHILRVIRHWQNDSGFMKILKLFSF